MEVINERIFFVGCFTQKRFKKDADYAASTRVWLSVCSSIKALHHYITLNQAARETTVRVQPKVFFFIPNQNNENGWKQWMKRRNFHWQQQLITPLRCCDSRWSQRSSPQTHAQRKLHQKRRAPCVNTGAKRRARCTGPRKRGAG